VPPGDSGETIYALPRKHYR